MPFTVLLMVKRKIRWFGTIRASCKQFTGIMSFGRYGSHFLTKRRSTCLFGAVRLAVRTSTENDSFLSRSGKRRYGQQILFNNFFRLFRIFKKTNIRPLIPNIRPLIPNIRNIRPIIPARLSFRFFFVIIIFFRKTLIT
jgi:hypothetical protein